MARKHSQSKRGFCPPCYDALTKMCANLGEPCLEVKKTTIDPILKKKTATGKELGRAVRSFEDRVASKYSMRQIREALKKAGVN